MKLHDVTLTNFMPYKGTTTIDFPTDSHRNVMIVFGDNMRGKTSLLNALRWGFYGRAVGRHSRQIPLHELPNREASLEGDWTMEVQIRFSADGHSYDLRRRADRRPYVATPTRPEHLEMQVYLRKDDLLINGDLIEAEINQFAPEQISRFFLFDGELLQEYEALLIEGSKQGEQIKEAIEQVLGVPSLTNGRDELSTLLSKAQKAQQKDLKHIQGLELLADRLEEMSARRDSIAADLQKLRERYDRTHDDRMTLEDEIEASQSVHAAKVKLDSLAERQQSIEDFQDQKRAERLEILSQAWKDLFEFRVSTRREQLELERDQLLAQIRSQSEVETKLEQMRALVTTSTCPTCGQSVDDDHRIEFGSDLGILEGEQRRFVDLTHRFQEVSSQINVLGKIRGISARDRLAQVESDLDARSVELTKIENEMERLRDIIEGYDTADIARKRTLRDEIIKEEARLQQDITQGQKNFEKIKQDLAVQQKAIEGASHARNQRSTVRTAIYTELELVFNRSIQSLRDKLRKTVEARASEAFAQMTTQKSYRGLQINQNYGLAILDESGRQVPLRSAGAEQIVALSLIDGLNRTGRSIGPVVMDTPFGRLDLKHRDNILRYLPTVTSQFVLLVHSGEIRPETDLDAIASRIGATYEIKEISSRHSSIERISN